MNEHGVVEESLLFHGSSVEEINLIVEDGWTTLEAGGLGGAYGSLLHLRPRFTGLVHSHWSRASECCYALALMT